MLIVPSLWLLWFVTKHLIGLYFSDGLYSFGIHLYYGQLKLYDPWSDVVVILSSITAFACGGVILMKDKLNIIALLGGALSLAIVVIGTINAL